MSGLKQKSAMLLGTLVLTGGMAAVNAAPASAASWGGCSAGKSCYYPDHNGQGNPWVAPSASPPQGGCWNLGADVNPHFNDTISSVWNRGGAVVNMYNWVGYWSYVASVQVGQQWSVDSGPANDVIDLVCIGRTAPQ